MNRTKLTIATLALVSLVSLSACNNSVTTNDEGLIITIKGADGTDTGYSADDLFEQYRGNQTGVARFVDAITEVVIRNEINQTDAASTALRNEILAKAENRVDGVKEQARSNADSNGTNYNTELDTLLESYNVEDLEELKDYFAYELMKEEVEDRYYQDNKTNFLLGDDYGPGYLEYRMPYHVKHILVKVSASGGDLYNGRISEGEARKLYAVGNRLALQQNNETFGEIAREMSEDTGSAANFGDLGIMSKATSFVNEFKLGVYSYDAVFNQNEEVNENARDLGVPEFAYDFFDTLGLGEIPFFAFDLLNQWANVTKDVDGNPVNENNPLYYPRNILFNGFFNKHNVSVITPEGLEGSYDLPGFTAVPELGNQEVLTDENGRVILVVRAGTGTGEGGYQGVHFIVVERSALIATLNGVSLEDYYTTEIPGTSSFPKNNDDEDLLTFVNYKVTTTANYKERAETVSTEIRNFDRHLSFRMIEQLMAEQAVDFNDETLEEAVLNYFEVTRNSSSFDESLQQENTWNSYIEFLEYQEFQRERLVELECAFDYQNPSASSYDIGGACYVK
jgi:parvulin-like peptidyl-prolyl isomerase